MKKFLSLFSLFSMMLTAVAQTGQVAVEPVQFKEEVHHFGSVPQNKPVYHYFEVKNTSAKPVVLNDIEASCGCTTPEWSKEPIPPGGTTTIKVGFNAAAEGPFEKYISVQYNGSGQKQIKITGTVWRAPAGAAPPNASVLFLKQQLQ